MGSSEITTMIPLQLVGSTAMQYNFFVRLEFISFLEEGFFLEGGFVQTPLPTGLI